MGERLTNALQGRQGTSANMVLTTETYSYDFETLTTANGTLICYLAVLKTPEDPGVCSMHFTISSFVLLSNSVFFSFQIHHFFADRDEDAAVKMLRFIVTNIATDKRKRVFLAHNAAK